MEVRPLRAATFARSQSPNLSGAHRLDDTLDAIRQEARAAKVQFDNDPTIAYRGEDPVFEGRFERTRRAAPGEPTTLTGKAKKWFRESFVTSPKLKGKDVVFTFGDRKLSRTEFYSPAIDRRRMANALHRNVLDEVQGDLQNVLATVKNPTHYEVFVRKVLADEAVEAWKRNDIAQTNSARVQQAEAALETARASGDRVVIRKAAEVLQEAKAVAKGGPRFEYRELGETRQQALADQAALDKILKQSPGLASAYQRHLKAINAARDELIARGLIAPNARDFYFPHYIVDFLQNEKPKNLPRGAGLAKAKSQNIKGRIGGREWSKDYISVMGTYLTRTKEMLLRHDLMDEIAHMYHVTHRPLASALEAPPGGLSDFDLYRQDGTIPRGYVRYQTSSGYSKPRASSLSERVFGQMTANAMDDIVERFGVSPHQFDEVLSEWQFGETLAKNLESRAQTGKTNDLQPQRGQEVVIPKELADELTIMAKGDIETSPLNRQIEGFTRWFKTFAIHARPIQYNVRNMLGDFQRGVVQFGPQNMLNAKLWKESLDDIVQAARKNYSHDWMDAHRYGLMSSGRTAVETVKIKDIDHFRRITGERANFETVKGWARWVGPIPAQMREDVFRMYLYKMNKSQWAKGGEKSLLYGAVDPAYVNGLLLSDQPARAWAAIARKSLIDFGDFTQSEEVLRNGLIPFYAWIKGNLSFWFRDLPTATVKALGRTTGGKATPSDVGVLSGTAAVVATVATARLWNMQNDEFEKAAETLPDAYQQQTTIILPDYEHWQATGELRPMWTGEGRDKRVVTLSLPDALDDALEASGMSGVAPDLKAALDGRMPWDEFIERRKEDAIRNPVNYAVKALGPITGVANIAAGLAGAGGLRTYPDVFEAKQVPPEKSLQTALGGMALSAVPGTEQAVELNDSQVASPVTKAWDVGKQLGYREVEPTRKPAYENELIYKINKLDGQMDELLGRITAVKGGLSEPQLTPEQREARVAQMVRIYRQQAADLKRLANRYHAVKRSQRSVDGVPPAGPTGQ